MKFPLIRTMTLAILTLLSLAVTGQDCYEKIISTSGNDNLYEGLESLACELKSKINHPGFEILGGDLYPLKYYMQPEDSFDNYFEHVVEGLDDASDSYILISKEYHPDGELIYRTHIKFPEVSPFLEMNPIEKEVVLKRVEGAIADYHGFGSTAEKNGLVQLIDIVENGLPDNALEETGFVKLKMASNGYSRTGGSSVLNNGVLDLCGGTITADNIMIKELFTGVNNYMNSTISTVITDDQNSNSEMQAAKEYMTEGFATDFSLWFHVGLKENGDIDAVYYKGTTLLTLAEIESRLFDHMNSFVNSTLDGKENLNHKSEPCDISWEFGKNCLLGLVSGSNSGLGSFHAGVGIGLLDGILSTFQLAWKGFEYGYDKIKDVVDWSPQDFESLQKSVVNKIIYGITFIKQIPKKVHQTKIKIDIFLYNSYNKVSLFLKEDFIEYAQHLYSFLYDPGKAIILAATVMKPILDLLKDVIGDYVSKDTAVIGYDIGKILYDILIDVAITAATGGSAGFMIVLNKLKTFARILKVNPRGFANLVAPKLDKIKNPKDAKSFKCAIGLGGCFVKDTPVLMAGNPFKNIATGVALAAMP